MHSGDGVLTIAAPVFNENYWKCSTFKSYIFAVFCCKKEREKGC